MSRPINQMMLNKPQVGGPAKGGSVRNTPPTLEEMARRGVAGPQPMGSQVATPFGGIPVINPGGGIYDGGPGAWGSGMNQPPPAAPQPISGVLQGPQPNISQEYLPGANHGAKGGQRQRPFLTKPGITTPAKGGPRNPPAYRGPRRRMR